jgi:hypothetical protein
MYQKGAGFYFRAGREVKAIREDCPPGKGKEERKKRRCHLSRPVSRGVGNPDRLRESLALFSPSFRQQNKEVILDDFPFLPCLSSPFEVLPLPSLSITYPGALLSNH